MTVDVTLPLIAINHGATYATNNQTPTISGTSNAAQGVLVTVTFNGGSAQTAAVQSDGTWNATPPSSLSPATYDVEATVSDAAGNVGTFTQSLTIDIVAPTLAIDGGEFRSTGDATPTISGISTGAPTGSAVIVSVDGQNLSTSTTSGGTWTVTAAHINNVIRVVAASVTDSAGNVGSDTQSLTINAVLPTVTIDGGASASTTDATPTISGSSTAAVGSAVVVVVGGVQTLNATVQPGGSWNVTSANIGNQTISVTVTVTDPDGNVGAASQTLTINSNAPTMMAIFGGLSRLSNDDTPTISGTTDAVDGRTVTVTVDGQSLTVNAYAGTWFVTATHIADGTYTVNASVSAGGNPGSASQSLTIDTIAPVVVLPGGGTVNTNDSTPAITGSGATPGATVTVTVAGQTMTTTVGADGTWSVTPPLPLGPGPHTVVVTITDAAGNLGTGTQIINVTATALPDFSSVGPSRVFDTRPGQSPLALRVVAKQQVGGGYELQVKMTDLPTLVPGGRRRSRLAERHVDRVDRSRLHHRLRMRNPRVGLERELCSRRHGRQRGRGTCVGIGHGVLLREHSDRRHRRRQRMVRDRCCLHAGRTEASLRHTSRQQPGRVARRRRRPRSLQTACSRCVSPTSPATSRATASVRCR